jgi:hypothetical protein
MYVETMDRCRNLAEHKTWNVEANFVLGANLFFIGKKKSLLFLDNGVGTLCQIIFDESKILKEET